MAASCPLQRWPWTIVSFRGMVLCDKGPVKGAATPKMVFTTNSRRHFDYPEVEARGTSVREVQLMTNCWTAQPDLDAIYNVAGGNAGLAMAVTESGRAGEKCWITKRNHHGTSDAVSGRRPPHHCDSKKSHFYLAKSATTG